MIDDKFFENKYSHNSNFGVALEAINKFDVYGIKLDLDVFLETYQINLQRPFVWTQLQKERYILSLLRNIDQSPFVIVQHKTPSTIIYKVIDGKQRLSTILSYLNGDFAIYYKGQNIYYENLSPLSQHNIVDNRHFKWNVHYSYENNPIEDDVLIDLFEQVNFMGTNVEVEHFESIKKIQNKIV